MWIYIFFNCSVNVSSRPVFLFGIGWDCVFLCELCDVDCTGCDAGRADCVEDCAGCVADCVAGRANKGASKTYFLHNAACIVYMHIIADGKRLL